VELDCGYSEAKGRDLGIYIYNIKMSVKVIRIKRWYWIQLAQNFFFFFGGGGARQ
jgi:hypothetical protein